jgi:23S rRNA pseudouridine2605 synthase
LKSGVTVDGVTYGPIEVTIDKATRTNSWITVRLREGKNREIRKVMAHLGLTVSRLIRVSYGPFQLGELDAGEVEEVKRSVLKDQLGIKTEGEGRAKAAPAKSGTNNFGPKKPGAGSAKSGKERMSKADRWATLTLGDKSSSRRSSNPNANNRRKASRD